MLDEDFNTMKILILSWRGIGHPNAGGAEISTHEHAKGWVKAGHSVTLFTSYYYGAAKEEIIDGVAVIRKGNQTLGVQLQVLKWFLLEDHPKYDLVIDQFHGIPFFTPLYVRVKKLAFIHEVAKEVWGLNPWPWPFSLVPKILGSVFEPLIFKLFYRNIPFMTVSISTKNDLIQWGIPEKNINIVHNGVNLPTEVKRNTKEKKKTLIFLGALTKDKGIEKALKIFSLLCKTNQDFQFWVVGKADPKYLNFLKGESRRLNIDTKIKFWGFITEEKKYELLKRAHILVNPSIREGWGLVVIEAAGVGTPTVAFNVPGLKDSIIDGKTGILTKELNEESLAGGIVNLLSDGRRYNRISHNANIWSQNFSWDKSSRMSMGLIKRIMR